MSEPFLGEIQIFAGNFAPRGWAVCDGGLMPITQNTALYSLLGTMYGGDGRTTFALPNLQGRAPMGVGQGPGLTNRVQGEAGGSEYVTLLTTEMPMHNHVGMLAASTGEQAPAPTTVWGKGFRTTTLSIFSASATTQMNVMALSVTGGSYPHNNMQPYLALTFIIALQGVFPSRP